MGEYVVTGLNKKKRKKTEYFSALACVYVHAEFIVDVYKRVHNARTG